MANIICFLILLNGHFVLPAYVTQTVYGFLDFTTTIENTVMIFSPQSAPVLDLKIKHPEQAIETKPRINDANTKTNGIITPTKLDLNNGVTTNKKTHLNVIESNTILQAAPPPAITPVIATKGNTVAYKNVTKSIESHVEDNFYQPEYDLLSRQPAEFVEETYRVVSFKSKTRPESTVRLNRKSSSSLSSPHSLIKSQNTAIAVSSSVIKSDRPKIRPSAPLRVLKTNAPVLPNSSSSGSSNIHSSSTNKKRNRHGNTVTTEANSLVIIESTTMPDQAGKSKKTTSRHKTKRRNKSSRSSSKKSQAHSQPTAPVTSTTASNAGDGGQAQTRRSFRPKIQPSPQLPGDEPTSLYLFKLNRTPGRWQYKAPPKPKVAIRKSQVIENAPVSNTVAGNGTARNGNGVNFINDNLIQIGGIPNDGDLEASGSQGDGAISKNGNADNPRYIVETLNVEISTPSDMKNTYYEIATIKTPVIYQAGSVKKTRYTTTTSTFEKIYTPEATSTEIPDGPLTQNILALTTEPDSYGVLDGSIATLNPIYLQSDVNTPILETVTSSFTFTQQKLRTQILPVVDSNKTSTTYLTLVQTYDITSFVTATKTISPIEGSQNIPMFNFKDFQDNLDEAGSEVNLELEFGDETNGESSSSSQNNNNFVNAIKPPDSPKNPFSLRPSEEVVATPGLLMPGFTVITTSYPVIKLETVWSTNIVPVINGQSTTGYRTLSQSIGTYERTEFKMDTSTVPVQQLAQPSVNPLSINPYLLQVPPQLQAVTTSFVYEGIATQTSSKVLKLTFGARTAYTTIYTTQVKPQLLTSFITTSLAVQPTSFPGYYPPPFPPYAYLG